MGALLDAKDDDGYDVCESSEYIYVVWICCHLEKLAGFVQRFMGNFWRIGIFLSKWAWLFAIYLILSLWD